MNFRGYANRCSASLLRAAVLGTATLTAAGTNTLAAATSAPALVSGAAPKWVTITIGGTDYLVQAFEKKP